MTALTIQSKPATKKLAYYLIGFSKAAALVDSDLSQVWQGHAVAHNWVDPTKADASDFPRAKSALSLLATARVENPNLHVAYFDDLAAYKDALATQSHPIFSVCDYVVGTSVKA